MGFSYIPSKYIDFLVVVATSAGYWLVSSPKCSASGMDRDLEPLLAVSASAVRGLRVGPRSGQSLGGELRALPLWLSPPCDFSYFPAAMATLLWVFRPGILKVSTEF